MKPLEMHGRVGSLTGRVAVRLHAHTIIVNWLGTTSINKWRCQSLVRSKTGSHMGGTTFQAWRNVILVYTLYTKIEARKSSCPWT